MNEIDNTGAVSTDTEGPESPVEAPGTTGVVEGTDTVSKAEYDALKATFDAYRRRTVAVATKYGNDMGGCSKVDQAIAEIDPTMRRLSYAATASVTVSLSVAVTDTRNPVTSERLWEALGTLAYELGFNRYGAAESVPSRYGKAMIVTPFVMVDDSTGDELPEYVTPQEWATRQKAQEAARQAEVRAEGQRTGRYGECSTCDTNQTWHYECPNTDCEEFVARDAEDNLIDPEDD